MNSLTIEIGAFAARKHAQQRRAARMVAFFLATGIDLDAALSGDCRQRARVAARLSRLVERERLRGLARHWAYDLNRHIALKEALDEIRGEPKVGRARSAPPRRPCSDKKAAPGGAAIDTLSYDRED